MFISLREMLILTFVLDNASIHYVEIVTQLFSVTGALVQFLLCTPQSYLPRTRMHEQGLFGCE